MIALLEYFDLEDAPYIFCFVVEGPLNPLSGKFIHTANRAYAGGMVIIS